MRRSPNALRRRSSKVRPSRWAATLRRPSGHAVRAMQPRPAMADQMENQDDMGALDKLIAFAREHPKLSVVGAAGIGLLGGAEVAAGVLIGAGGAALLHLELGRRSAR